MDGLKVKKQGTKSTLDKSIKNTQKSDKQTNTINQPERWISSFYTLVRIIHIMLNDIHGYICLC
ncbi:Uncharacterised protein [Providencia rustigianii]|nr:Uncharacterised protein [Providencia rustigianii]